MEKIIIQCSSCEGTGLYKGFAENGKSAVVCHVCNGTGKIEFNYNEFTGRKTREDVSRVYDGSHGYGITDVDIKTDGGKVIHFSQGGCTYQEWLNGMEPKPIKDLYCPYLWKNTGIGNEPLERCERGCKGFGSISDCAFYSDKVTCWELYDTIMK